MFSYPCSNSSLVRRTLARTAVSYSPVQKWERLIPDGDGTCRCRDATFTKMNDQDPVSPHQKVNVNIKFVQEVKKHPILYNSNVTGHLEKRQTEKTWQEIGNTMKWTAMECRDRWKNIRTAYARHLKQRKREPYYLAGVLDFIVPFIKTRTESKYVTQEEHETFVYADDDDDDDDDNSNILTEITQPPSPSSHPPSKSQSPSSTSPFVTRSAKRKRAAAIVNSADQDLNEYFDFDSANSLAKQAEQETSVTRREALRMFLLSMLPDLMQMDDREVRHFKKTMLTTVDDILSAKSK